MSKKTLKFGENVLNKKDYYASKKAIPLKLVDAKYIVVSYRVKISDNSCKYFTGYKSDNEIRSLCIILPQMNVYIKYFENGSKKIPLKLRMRVFI